MFALGINTALRISDILPLKVGDISEVRNGKRVIRTHVVKMREKKTRKEKMVYINDELKKVLEQYISTMESPEDWKYLFPSRQKTSRTQKERTERHLTRYRAIQIIKDVTGQFGIENIGTHTMRKTFGYHSYNERKDIASLQTLFNHSDPSYTLRYIGIDQNRMDNLVKGVSYTK